MIDLPVTGVCLLKKSADLARSDMPLLRPKIESDNWNRYIAIDVETGQFAIADRSRDAMRRFTQNARMSSITSATSATNRKEH